MTILKYTLCLQIHVRQAEVTTHFSAPVLCTAIERGIPSAIKGTSLGHTKRICFNLNENFIET